MSDLISLGGLVAAMGDSQMNTVQGCWHFNGASVK